MDLTSLTDYIMTVPLLACLVVGWLIKNTPLFAKIANDYIPLIVATIGAVLGLFVGGFTIESAVFGAISGLASTGLHQIFSRLISKEEGDT